MKLKTYDQLSRQYARAQRRLNDLSRARICKAHPATQGFPSLVSNWGNDEAKRLSKLYYDRQRRLYDTWHAMSRRAMHRDHEKEGRVGAYLWCDHCTPHREAYEKRLERPLPASTLLPTTLQASARDLGL